MTTELFLQQFFGNSNKIQLEQVLKHEKLSFLRNSILRLNVDPQEFVILPFVFSDKKSTLWCGIAFNEEQSNEMRSLLNYFVGSSYSNLNIKSTINPKTPIGAVIKQLTNLNYCTKFQGDYVEVQTSLERMFDLLSRRPYRQVKKSISTGSLLRSYNYALILKDEIEAHRLIGELRSRKFLDAVSQTYLNIEVAAHFSKWDIIYNHPQFKYILNVRRPAKITSYLLQATFEIEIAPLLEEHNIKKTLDYFINELLPKLQPLFIDGLVDSNMRVLKMWMLKVMTDEKFDSIRYNLLIEEVRKLQLDDKEWNALIKFKTADVDPVIHDSQTLQEMMIRSLREGDLIKAKEFGRGAPPSLAKAQMFMECALQHRDIDAFNDYLLVKEKLSEEAITFLDETINHSIGSKAKSEDWYDSKITLPANWIDLINRMNEDDEFAKIKSKSIILNSSFSKIKDFGEDVYINLERLNEALGNNRSLVSSIALKEILPHLIVFLREIKIEDKSKVPVFDTILDLLLTTEELRKSDLQMINDLVDNVLNFGVPKERYTEILMAVDSLQEYYGTAHTLECLMEFIEVTIQYRVQDNGAFQVVLANLKRIIAHQSKLKPQDDIKLLFNTICSFLSVNDFSFELDVEQVVEVTNPWQFYKDKSIGIYSLTESATQRAQEFLEQLNLNIITTINKDHVGSDALRDLSRRSDFFVIVSGSAKHAATDFIKQHRSIKPLLYAPGKGSSSILSVLREYAKGESQT